MLPAINTIIHNRFHRLQTLATLTGIWAVAGSVGMTLPVLAAPLEVSPSFSSTSRLHPQRTAASGVSQFYWAGNPVLPTRKAPSTTQGGATRSAVMINLKYVPPANLPKRERPMTTGGAATRSLEIFVELLAPYDHTGLTTAARPTLAWFISDIPASPLELTIRNEQTTEVLFQKRLIVKRAGIMYFVLPPDAPQLQPGVEYKWSLTIPQDGGNVVHQAWIQRQALTPEQDQVFAAAKSGRERAQLYAGEGFWYDVMAQVTMDYLGSPELMMTQDNLLGLLAQVELDQMVDLEPGSLVVDSSALSSSTVTPSPKPAATTVPSPSPVNR